MRKVFRMIIEICISKVKRQVREVQLIYWIKFRISELYLNSILLILLNKTEKLNLHGETNGRGSFSAI